jgi:hypothetical protein
MPVNAENFQSKARLQKSAPSNGKRNGSIIQTALGFGALHFPNHFIFKNHLQKNT